jgi:S-adenosylmethionine-dependent methyltransferase
VPDESLRQTFDDHLAQWRAWQQAPWGRIRYRVVTETLGRVCRALGPAPLRVLDVGGGDGADVLPLAAAGHDVTIVDYSAPLLAVAGARAADLGVQDRVRSACADLEELPRLGLGTFDLVLCHNVLQYADDTRAVVELLCSATRPGGRVSLMAPNPASDVLTAAIRREDLAEATAMLTAATTTTHTFDHAVRRVGPEEVMTALEALGMTRIERFGVRCVTDYIADDERKHDPDFYAALEQLELRLCDSEPYLRTARLWQLVARH